MVGGANGLVGGVGTVVVVVGLVVIGGVGLGLWTGGLGAELVRLVAVARAERRTLATVARGSRRVFRGRQRRVVERRLWTRPAVQRVVRERVVTPCASAADEIESSRPKATIKLATSLLMRLLHRAPPGGR